MVRKIKHIFHTIRGKLMFVTILLIICPLIILGLFSYDKSKTSLDELGAINLQNSVEHTLEMINVLQQEVEEGNISLDKAQEAVKVSVLGEKEADGTRPINQNFNLGENGYIFIVDDDGNQLASSTVEGQNTWDTEDPNGVKTTQGI